MKKMLKFILVSAWILLSRSYDAYATYQYTPDLAHEANPLVSFLGFGWTPLLLLIGVLTIAIIYAYYKSVFKPFNLHPKTADYTYSEFVGFVYTGKKQAWYSLLFKLPNSLKRFTYFMGNVFTLCLAFAGVISTIMWLLINYVPAYMEIHTAKLIYGIIIIGCIIIHQWWFSAQYKLYKQTE